MSLPRSCRDIRPSVVTPFQLRRNLLIVARPLSNAVPYRPCHTTLSQVLRAAIAHDFGHLPPHSTVALLASQCHQTSNMLPVRGFSNWPAKLRLRHTPLDPRTQQHRAVSAGILYGATASTRHLPGRRVVPRGFARPATTRTCSSQMSPKCFLTGFPAPASRT